MIINGDSRVVRMTLQVVASPAIIIMMTLDALMIINLMTLEVSVTLLEIIDHK